MEGSDPPSLLIILQLLQTMSIKDYVIENIDPEVYYKKRFPKWIPKTNVNCIFHSDRSPSLALSLDNGGARCHAANCGKRIGNIVHFESAAEEIKETEAAFNLYKEFIRPVINPKIIRKFCDELAANPVWITKIKKEMGLTSVSIQRFNLGFDLVSQRITIPIYDKFQLPINIRFYRLPSTRRKNESKIYNYKEGYGQTDLFPWQETEKFKLNKPVFFMASEKESMIMLQHGHYAVCSTTGEGTYNKSWNSFFHSRQVYIIPDADEAGAKAAKVTEGCLREGGVLCVHILKIPFKSLRPDHKDFADWVIKQKGNPSKLASIAKQNSPSARSEATQDCLKEPELPDFLPDSEGGFVDIAEIGTNPSLLNRRVKSQGIVASKAGKTYSLPWKFKLDMGKHSTIHCESIGRELLRFVRAPDGAILQSLQKKLKHKIMRCEILERITVTEVEVIPIAAMEKDVPYVVQRCFFFGCKIDANIPYLFEIIPTTEIQTQETVGIITKIEPMSVSIDKFVMTPELEAELTTTFQPDENENSWSKLKRTSKYIAANYTRVYNRLDWHIIALLTWLCPIGFYFPDEPTLQRGWVNSLALGDTQTGKSKVAEALQKIFNCGVFVNAENCTYVGLVGGAIKAGSGQLMLRWGRIPLSDRQLVVLEELSGLSVEEISNMSEVRSSGIARLDKGGINSQTNSRTRLLCLSNVRSQYKNLSGYLFGVKAIQELIGHGEDIARFDLITTLIDGEVDIGVINQRKDFATVAKESFEDVVTEPALRKLCQFVWSLTPKQILFNDTAYNECLESTKVLSVEYHPSIPIFKGGSGRYKLARIAAAIACFQFSYRKGSIVVTQDHVRASVKLLRLIYNKQSFGYAQYSEQQFSSERIAEPQELQKALLEKIPQKKKLVQILTAIIHATSLTKDEFLAITGLTTFGTDSLINVFLLGKVIRKGYGPVWEVTIAGKKWMESIIHKYENNRY